ncbi:MAG: DCC1-like thiol-disulfide oxidoreductase family protein [Flavobacteriales bacterium]
MSAPLPVVFYDGHCGLCDRSVQWLLRMDRRAALRFAPLQGTTASKVLPRSIATHMDSFVLLDGNGVHLRSDAAIRVLEHLGGAWRSIRLLRLMPRVMRDSVYDLIARRRHRWFGRMEHCRLPGPGEGARFLP